MPKFVIEREIPEAGGLSAAEMQAVPRKPCGVLNTLGPQIQWVDSIGVEDMPAGFIVAGRLRASSGGAWARQAPVPPGWL